VVASHDREDAPRVGKAAFLDIFDPGSVHPDWYIVFSFACHGTGVTPDTLSIVYDEAEVHLCSFQWLARQPLKPNNNCHVSKLVLK
jgi:hypothetical protein